MHTYETAQSVKQNADPDNAGAHQKNGADDAEIMYNSKGLKSGTVGPITLEARRPRKSQIGGMMTENESVGDVATEAVPLEAGIKSSAGGALSSVLWRLPAIWKARRDAKRLVSALPEYDGAVEAPPSDLIYSWIEGICQTPHRRPGTPDGRSAEEWVADRMREIGLEDVTMDPVPITVWSADEWSLEVEGEDIPGFYIVNTDSTGADGVTAPLVYVGEGRPEDFETADVSGKIVVAEVPFPNMPTGFVMKYMCAAYALSDPDRDVTLRYGQCLPFIRGNFKGGTNAENAPANDVYWQSFRRGAAGILLILRDQPTHSNTHYGPYDGIMKPMPGLWIGKQDGMRLRGPARQGREATLTLESKKEPGEMRNVWGVLPGASDDVILVTSHHDSPFEGASEDGSGVAQVLAQAWAWSRVPKERRPKTLVFVVDGGHFYGSLGCHTFAREHKDIMERARIAITLEHLAAKEVEDKDGEYSPTGKLAFTVMFTSLKSEVIAAVMRTLDRTKPKLTASIPADFFAPAPTSDASGYVLEAGLPVISWIGCPYYLLDAHDTLDKIDKSQLRPIAETTTELVKTFMAME